MHIQMQMRQVEINREIERRRIEIENHRIEIDKNRRQAEMQHELELARLNAASATTTSVPSSAGSAI
jgi:hypothetical protein